MHRIIRVYSLLAVLLDPIVHVFLENTVYGVYTVHRIIRVYSMLSKEKGPYGATMFTKVWDPGPGPGRSRSELLWQLPSVSLHWCLACCNTMPANKSVAVCALALTFVRHSVADYQ